MQKVLVLTCLILQTLAMIPFLDYKKMCVGKTNCYAIFTDSRVSTLMGIDYSSIERYPWIIPAYTNAQMNIGWAQSHSMAFSYRIWNSYYNKFGQPYPNKEVIAELSFVKVVLENNFTSCKSPKLLYPANTNSSLIHMPLFYSRDYIHRVYNRPAFNYNAGDIARWCDLKALKAENVTGIKSTLFTGYDNYLLRTPITFNVLSNMIKVLGIGLVAVPHDKQIAELYPSYPSGFYKLTGPMMYYYPANVVGCYVPGNGTIYLLVYMFGAQNYEVNYLFVDFSMVSLKNWITMIYRVENFS